MARRTAAKSHTFMPLLSKRFVAFFERRTKLKSLNKYKLVTFNEDAFYTNINTQHAIETLKEWLQLHKKEVPNNFSLQLVLKIDTSFSLMAPQWEQI